MHVPKTLSDKFELLDRARFEAMKSEFRPAPDLPGLKYLRDKAGNEKNLRELYRGRALYELLQNADDAEAKNVAFILSNDGLAFAHDGRWFTVANFRSLADGWSDKDPDQCIGHKGLGFRSVLDISPSPHVIKVGTGEFFVVKFSWALNYGYIQEMFKQNPGLREHYQEWTQHGQLACPVMAIPGIAKRPSIGSASSIFDKLAQGDYQQQFTTMFWFPAHDPDIDAKTLKELDPISIAAGENGRRHLSGFLTDEVRVLLPFLQSVVKVDLYDHFDLIGSVRLVNEAAEGYKDEITVLTSIQGQNQSTSFFQMRFRCPIPIEVKRQPGTPKAVQSMKEASITLSAQLKERQPIHDSNSRLHVYFPTEEKTGVGFVVHGDFSVKPDRTRLVPSHYNEWLIGQAAAYAANEFLTALMQRFRASAVFEALAPTSRERHEADNAFVRIFAEALRERTAPYIPTRHGLVAREEAVLPPSVDTSGFWEEHFADNVAEAVEGKVAFLAHQEDGVRPRDFLSLAQVRVLDPVTLLSFISIASHTPKPAVWWYECYAYMAHERKLSTYDHSVCAGHKLIPLDDDSVVNVPDGSNQVACLPPADYSPQLRVPACFSSLFVFVNAELAKLLDNGESAVKSWVLDRLRISRFEATDVLPRAIRAVVQKLFDGQLRLSLAELRQAWIFIFGVVKISRSILAEVFWREIGRFPLPMDKEAPDGALEPDSLIPAFLAYLPDSFLDKENCLVGVDGFSRINSTFLEDLLIESEVSRDDWIEFFGRAGVSASPKELKYSLVVAGGQDLPFVSDIQRAVEHETFSGERQIDENCAVVVTLKTDDLWEMTVRNAQVCTHGTPKVLQSLKLVEGLNLCTQVAEEEFRSGNSNWRERLWHLIKQLPVSSLDEPVQALCRGGRPGGHSIHAVSYLRKQLEHYRWLPSTHGPASSSECFSRLTSRRLISTGRSEEEIGDVLLPYVVVDTIDDLARLQRLGVSVLEDAASASPAVLVRALALLGERLSTEWGQQEILEVRGRWRLVRGTIQEIYRALNQHQQVLEIPVSIKLASRLDRKVEFRPSPLYYAEPGSSIERAFATSLPLFDADRPYSNLFKHLGITQLIPSQTVRERFLAEEASVSATQLRDQIINDLLPYLLALIAARSEQSKQVGLMLRRMRERFEVKTTDHLAVSYSLVEDPSLERNVDFPKFYLQRRLVAGPGAIQEAQFTLYVVGDSSISLLQPELDADALGEELARVLLEGTSEELAGLFPRIVSRYQVLRGEREAVGDFLYYQLGISREAQESAWAIVTGETPEVAPAVMPPPPPTRVIATNMTEGGKPPNVESIVTERLRQHQERMKEKTQDLVNALASHASTRRTFDRVGGAASTSRARLLDEITPEQKARGKQGEEEIKRRLLLPGGWEGLGLVADKRDTGCGYDFLCIAGEREVKFEVKAFTTNGRVIVSSNELQEAALSQDDYYLVGLLDNGKPEFEWRALILRNPIAVLLTKGEFDIQAKLQASVSDLFDLS